MSSAMNEEDLKQLNAHVTQLEKGLKSAADLGALNMASHYSNSRGEISSPTYFEREWRVVIRK